MLPRKPLPVDVCSHATKLKYGWPVRSLYQGGISYRELTNYFRLVFSLSVLPAATHGFHQEMPSQR